MYEKDKRRMILDAALELIREKGLEGTRIIDIAQKAGIGKGTVYDYFSSKEEVIAASVKDVVDRDFRNIFDDVNRAPGFESKLKLFIRAHFRIVEMYGPFMALFAEQQWKNSEGASDEVRKVVDEIREGHVQKLQEIVAEGIGIGALRPGLDVRNTVTYIFSVIIGFGMTRMEPCCSKEAAGGTGTETVPEEDVMSLILQGIRQEKEVSYE